MYIPIKVTTDYSLLKSLIKVKDLINFCHANNISSCAICDNNLFGSIEFYILAKKNNIKPIIGIEVTINNYIIYLYARNYDGYKNLLKINTIVSERNLSILELKKYSYNLICVIPYKSINIYNEMNFFEYLYLSYENKDELQNILIKTNNVIYLNDIRVFNKNDLKYLTYLDKINGIENSNYLNNYFNYDNLDDFDLNALDKFNNLINIEIPFNTRYIPKYREDVDSYLFITNLAKKGLYKRLNGKLNKTYIDRLNYELEVIKNMNFIDYFLIVYDYVLYAKKNNILVGPGRGSAAGSLVSYCLGITDIDPIKYNLLFERFLNPERVSMPDIDIDFDNTKREQVINYVKEKYGIYNVSGGMTYTTLKTRLVLREVGKLLEIDDNLLNKFLKVINRNLSLKDNLKVKVVNDYLKSYNNLKKVYEVSLKLEGLKKNISTHAAGIVIGDRVLDEIIPIYKNNDDYLCGIGLEYLENIGLLKMDFLALKNLSTISNIIKNIKGFNLNDIPLNDSMVYKLFQNGDTSGIFQFETNTFKSMLVKYKPTNFEELVASIALVRPGPSVELSTYIKRKNGQEKITYYDPKIKDILEETYGVIVYQEQVISILVKVANFTYAEADNIRRAMSKKNINIIKEAKLKFLENATKNGYDINTSQNIFNHILKFAEYGFNKAHSVSYATVSYQMAYLKVHYHHLFIFELLNNSLGNIIDTKKYLNELKKDNLVINEVDINKSSKEFILDKNNVYLPFNLIRGTKDEVINKLLTERNNNKFSDIYDFFARTSSFLTKFDYTTLINANTLRVFNYNQKTLINNLDSLINYGKLYQDMGSVTLKPKLDIYEDELDNKRLNELNSYGFYISNHPASKYLDNCVKLDSINNYLFKNIVCYVLIESIKKIKTKKNEDMAFISGSDETGVSDFTVFPNKFYLINDVEVNNVVKVWCTVTKRYDKLSLVINNIIKE